MKRLLPDLLGTGGYCLLLAGIYTRYGLGPALIAGGVLMMAGAFLAAKAVRQ